MNSNLKRLRKSRKLPQIGLSAKSGVPASVISAIEKWGVKPSEAVKARLAKALGVQVIDLWPEEPESEVTDE